MAAEFVEKKTDSLEEEEEAAQVVIWKYLNGFILMSVIKCAIELGIPDILEKHKSTMTVADLASEVGCSESSLHRIMRFLIHYKVFQEKQVSETCVGYTQTGVSRLLTRHGKNSMADFVLLSANPVMMAPWQKLSDWVLGNKELPFVAAHGTDIWGFFAANPDFSKLFNNGIACNTRLGMAAISVIEVYP